MKCYVCGFCDPENMSETENTPRFIEVTLSGDDVFKKQDYRAGGKSAFQEFPPGWYGSGRTNVYACPQCGTLKIKGTKDNE